MFPIFDAEVRAGIIGRKPDWGYVKLSYRPFPLNRGYPGFSPGLHPSEEGFGREIHTFGVIL